jgi:tRNA (guanosine-2'-O-)-methyltransferase
LTEHRYKKFLGVVGSRQKFLTLVLENIHDPHNASAILRTADAVGVDKIYLVYNTNKFPKMGRNSSASAKKWIELIRFSTIRECYDALRKENYKIYSTHMGDEKKTCTLYDLDLTKKSAIVLGNEHLGVSEEARELADKNFLIPMHGMIQSLNVSVSAAICLYEALRQRTLKGMYLKSAYTKSELKLKLESYLKK